MASKKKYHPCYKCGENFFGWPSTKYCPSCRSGASYLPLRRKRPDPPKVSISEILSYANAHGLSYGRAVLVLESKDAI